MLTLARFSIRRPKIALAGWLLIAAVLTVVGLGVSSALSPSITVVPGTQSSRAQQLADAQFGQSQLVPIMLEGPRAQLDVQGPKLVAALARRTDARVISAWSPGTAGAGLRPTPTAAMIVVSVDRPIKTVVSTDQPQIERLVARQVSGPVKAFVTGQPSIDRAVSDASTSTLRSTELIAIAILFVLLVIGLRAPVAALLVTAVGALSTLAGFGEVALLGRVLPLDPVGVALGTMTGLALGVAFALLILDRFHRERKPGVPTSEQAGAAVRELETTGRAVLIGGTAIVVALAIVAVVGPTALMISVGTGMLTCAAFATGGAVVVMPAALVLLGGRIEALSFPAPAILTRGWAKLSAGGAGLVVRRAAFAGAGATAVLALLAVPALALHSGPPDVSQLPAGAKARVAFEEVSRVMGPGWATPYNMVVVAQGRPLTTPALLANVEKFQKTIQSNTAVKSVVGPGEIGATAKQLSTFGPQLRHSAVVSDKSKKDLLTLIKGLGQAGAGSKLLRTGLAQASTGAGALHAGSGQAQSGAGQLHDGLAQASAGSTSLASGLNQALAGARALEAGAGQALIGSKQLVAAITLAQGPAGQSLPALQTLASATAGTSSQTAQLPGRASAAQQDAGAALAALQSMTGGKSDPQYQAVVSALQRAQAAASGLSSAAATAASSAAGAKSLASMIAYQAPGLVAALNMLHDGASQLRSGVSQLESGNSQLAGGMSQLAGGGGQLTSGLGQLTAGAAALQAGLGQLTGGTGQLASGLTSGVNPAGQLVAGLGTMQAAVIKARGQIPSTVQLKQLQRESPGLFTSGYFVLAAVEGSTTATRTAATFMLNVDRGGNAGQIVVVSKFRASDPRSQALAARLVAMGTAFGARNHVQVAVGGPAGSLGDLTSATRSRVALDVTIVALAIALVLALATRAVLLPLVASACGLLVAGATFGILQILFGGSNPPMGGPGYLDPISIIGIFTVVFAVSAMYSALLLLRIREAYVAGRDVAGAVAVGLRETAAPATGAGLVMVAALVPFAATDLLNVRAFGIGLAVAILLDTFILRPVLLPAAVAVLGRVGWWPTHTGGARAEGSGRAGRRPWLHHGAGPSIGVPR